MAASITPYNINVPESKISALKARLEHTALPDELNDAEWSLGAPLSDVRRLANAWKGFDWQSAERKLNEMPQFTTIIDIPGFDPLEIHFVHQKSSRKNAIPLLFLHGWPGSFIEVSKILPLLTSSSDPDTPSFHVVAPSLASFGFSEGPKKKGFGLKQHAQAVHGGMQDLFYSEYVAPGVYWGSVLVRVLARLYPDSLMSTHINFPVSSIPKPWYNPICFLQAAYGIVFYAKDRQDLKYTQKYLTEKDGYKKEQETKPQTLGYGLADSPVFLLAWIYEKLHDWSDSYPWTDEEVLTWVSIYAFSRMGPEASVRIYHEAESPSPGGISTTEIVTQYVGKVPLSLAYFPNELVRLPLSWAHTLGVVVQQSEFDAGGHFAAFEVPELLAGDLRKLFGKRGACFGVVKGKDGY